AWLAGRAFDQSVQTIAGEHGNRELERDEVKEGVASEPESGQQAVKPAMEGGKLAQAHEEAGERRGPEKARILSLAEQEPDQRQQQERSSHVQVHARAEVRQQQREGVLGQLVAGPAQDRLWN